MTFRETKNPQIIVINNIDISINKACQEKKGVVVFGKSQSKLYLTSRTGGIIIGPNIIPRSDPKRVKKVPIPI